MTIYTKLYTFPTRDNNTVYIPDTFGNVYYYQTKDYYCYASIEGISILNETDSEHEDRDLNNSDSDNNGFAIKCDVPIDRVPASVVAGTFFHAVYNYNLQGIVWYEGKLKQPSIQPTNLNHWSTYIHHKSTSWFSSPTITYPKGAAITISPQKYYSEPVVDVILNTWYNDTWYNN